QPCHTPLHDSAWNLAAVPKTLPVNSSNIFKVLVLGQKKGPLSQPHCLLKINPTSFWQAKTQVNKKLQQEEKNVTNQEYSTSELFPFKPGGWHGGIKKLIPMASQFCLKCI
uniref:Uncharacterized protein n=1 Tax=Taeniopygia guttata TaxID=59729 RepID=A0A674HBK7_TAEGU